MATQAPVNVSPLIKAARWGFLVAGVCYGVSRYNFLMRRENKRLQELERTRPEREAKKAAEAAIRAKEEEQMWVDLLNPSPKN